MLAVKHTHDILAVTGQQHRDHNELQLPYQSLREQLHAALAGWAAVQNVIGQVTTYSVGFPPEYDDDPPLDLVQMYESPGVELAQLLDADAAARAGTAPDGGDEGASLHYAAARLRHLQVFSWVRLV